MAQDWLHKLEQRARREHDAHQRLMAGFDRAGLSAPPRVQDILRLRPGHGVFRADWRGETVVVKQFYGPGRAATVAALDTELAFQAARMASGPCQVNLCRAAFADQGIAVLSFAPGQRLSDRLKQAGPARRRRLMRAAGQWLAVYTEPRRSTDSFGPGFWVKRCAGIDRTGLETQDRALLDRLQGRLRRIADLTHGRAVLRGASHGDFVPLNLHVQAGTLYGVDIQGTHWVALAKEAARFLVWTVLDAPDPAPDRPDSDDTTAWGVARTDLQALLTQLPLAPGEAETSLPFFLGEQYYCRLIGARRFPDQQARLRAAIARFLADTEPFQPGS